jgi:hypothetical protein
MSHVTCDLCLSYAIKYYRKRQIIVDNANSALQSIKLVEKRKYKGSCPNHPGVYRVV